MNENNVMFWTVTKSAYIITIFPTVIFCPLILSVCCWFQLSTLSICKHYGNFCGLFHPLLLRKCHPTLQALKSCQWRMSRLELGLGYLNFSHRLIILSWYHVIISLFSLNSDFGQVVFLFVVRTSYHTYLLIIEKIPMILYAY